MILKAALGQIQSKFNDFAENVTRHVSWTTKAKEKGAQLIVFPELSLTGYYLREAVSEAAVDINNPVLKKIIKASDGIGIIAGFVEKEKKGKYFNSAIVCENGKVVGIHRKLCLPTYGMFEEGRYFTAGCKLKSFDLSWGRLGIAICEDAWYPELVMRHSGNRLDLLAILSASPVRGITHDRGITNVNTNKALCRFYTRNLKVPVIFLNKPGYENGICFWGGSAAYSSEGELINSASLIEEDLIHTDIDLKNTVSDKINQRSPEENGTKFEFQDKNKNLKFNYL